jgi:hypothetical protein
MSGRMARKARGIAHGEAVRRGLWGKGEKGLYTWWRRLIAKLFPKFRKRYADAVGRWYKATLKTWARNIRHSFHDRDAMAFEKARARIRKDSRKPATRGA